MRDFRLPNVLTCHGIEGDYVVVDMECAGPDCSEWTLDPLDKWDVGTLHQVSFHAASVIRVVAVLAACTSMTFGMFCSAKLFCLENGHEDGLA